MINKKLIEALSLYSNEFSKRAVMIEKTKPRVSSLPFIYSQWLINKFKVKPSSFIDLNMVYFILDMPLPLREAFCISLQHTFHKVEDYEVGSIFEYFIDSGMNNTPNVILYPVMKKDITNFVIENDLLKEEGVTLTDFEDSQIFYCVKTNNSRDKFASISTDFCLAIDHMTKLLQTNLRQKTY